MQGLMCRSTKQTGTTTIDLDLTTEAFLAMGHLASHSLFYLLTNSFCVPYLVCDKMMPRFTFTYPSWLPGFMCYCVFYVPLVSVRLTDPTTSFLTRR